MSLSCPAIHVLHFQRPLLGISRDLVASALALINVVNRQWAWLIIGWVTAY